MKISQWESIDDLAYAASRAAILKVAPPEDITDMLLAKLSCRKAGALDRHMDLARKARGIEATIDDLKRDAELCDKIQDIKTNQPDEWYNMVRLLAREGYNRMALKGGPDDSNKLPGSGLGREHYFSMVIHLLMEKYAPWSDLTSEGIEKMLDEEEDLLDAGSSATSLLNRWTAGHYLRATHEDAERLLEDESVKLDDFDEKLILSSLIPISPDVLQRLAHQDVGETTCETEEDLRQPIGCNLGDMEVEHLRAICERRGLLKATDMAAAAKQNKLKLIGNEIYTETRSRSYKDIALDAQTCLKIRDFKREDPKEWNRMLKNLIKEKIDMFSYLNLSEEDQLKTDNLISVFRVVMARYDPVRPLTRDQVDKLFTDRNAFERWDNYLQSRGDELSTIDRELRMLDTYDFLLDDFDAKHILPSLVAITPDALDRLAARSVDPPPHPIVGVLQQKLWSNMKLGGLIACIFFALAFTVKKFRATNKAQHPSSKEHRNRTKKKVNRKKKKN